MSACQTNLIYRNLFRIQTCCRSTHALKLRRMVGGQDTSVRFHPFDLAPKMGLKAVRIFRLLASIRVIGDIWKQLAPAVGLAVFIRNVFPTAHGCAF